MSLQGTFKTLGITEVLEFLSTRTASGRLDVTTEMGTAVYVLSDGAVSAAEYSFIRESGVDAAEATYYVVSELDGSFFFDDDVLDNDGVAEVEGGPEDVAALLFRTADIAERWADVEEVIPSPNHLLTRNTQLDGSVTIQPEWWKALEMIGEGSTSLELASTLQLSALDASLTALAMTNAGLLLVTEIDPLNIALSPELEDSLDTADHEHTIHDELAPAAPQLAEPDPEAVLADAVDALDTLVQAPEEVRAEAVVEAIIDAPIEPTFDPEPTAFAPDPSAFAVDPATFGDASDPSIFEPVDMLEMVDVEPPTPAAVDHPPEVPAEPTMSFSTPADDHVEQDVATLGALEAPVGSLDAAQYVAPSGMDDHSELEYMVEPEGSTPVVPVDDDDGWSNAHTPSELSPMAAAPAPAPATPAPAPAPATPAPAPQPVPAPEPVPEASAPHVLSEPSPFDGLPAPGQPSPFDSPAPIPDVPGAMDVSSLPSPPPPVGDEHRPVAPVPDVAGYGQPAAVPESTATSMAGEVLDDLASMTDELNEPIGEDSNWQLDGTFVPETNPTPPPVDGDPFGDLGDLLTDDDERSSVLKFLRRD